MKVNISNNYSETQNILNNVPQESILGPLLFLKFINVLPNDIKSEIELFVDDVKLVLKQLLKETTQLDLNKLSY